MVLSITDDTKLLYILLLSSLKPHGNLGCITIKLVNELSSFSEVRAHYSLFLLIGLLAFIAMAKTQLLGFTYWVYLLIFGSYLIGRFVSIFIDGMPDTTLWFVILAELLVVLISVWRLKVKAIA